MRSTGRAHGLTIRGHNRLSPSLGVRPYSSNSSREERLLPCRHPSRESGYLRRQRIPFKIVNSHRGTRRCKAGSSTESHWCLMLLWLPIWAFQKIIVPTLSQTPAATAAAASSTSSATTTWSTSVKAARTAQKAKAARTAAKQRRRWRRPCVVFIPQENVS